MEQYLGIIGFVTVTAITPGPNNFVVLAAASRRGVVATIPLAAGVVIGSLGLLALVWSGASMFFDDALLRRALTITGGLYLSWLGIAMCRFNKVSPEGGRPALLPDSFTGMMAFQFLNPKAWILMLTAATHSSGTAESLLALIAIVTAALSLCLAIWAGAGTVISNGLRSPRSRYWFDCIMGLLLIGSAILLVTQH